VRQKRARWCPLSISLSFVMVCRGSIGPGSAPLCTTPLLAPICVCGPRYSQMRCCSSIRVSHGGRARRAQRPARRARSWGSIILCRARQPEPPSASYPWSLCRRPCKIRPVLCFFPHKNSAVLGPSGELNKLFPRDNDDTAITGAG
jgi:hypothetical protein